MKVGLLIGAPFGIAVGTLTGVTHGTPHAVGVGLFALLGVLAAAIILAKLLNAIFT